jgi:thiol-disulfide isomerase/thioredoxin
MGRALRMRLPFLIATASIALVVYANNSGSQSKSGVAPEFTHRSASDWLNSEPLTLERLRGKPTLIEFWTFDCINCLRSIDWMKSIAKRQSGLNVVAVHTPELDHERQPENVYAAIRKLGIDYPVMLDRDFSYWQAMNNQYWPAFYLLGKDGRIRAQIIGELHVGEARALQFEREIERALAE